MELEFVLSSQFSTCSRIDAFLDLLRAMDYSNALIGIPCDRQCSAGPHKLLSRSTKCCFWLTTEASLNGRVAIDRCTGRAFGE